MYQFDVANNTIKDNTGTDKIVLRLNLSKGTDMTVAAQNPSQILPPEFAARATLTIEESAAILRISRSSAYAAANDRTLPTVKIGRRLLVPRVALERLLGGV